ncbi:MAG: alcohol acetyltransferase [Oscillospiraceae bacterium]|jgi:NRPS condensation-like uncharacterized protein|nr:alcohol acetyltransferase [Oscillospiraceae bacterium]
MKKTDKKPDSKAQKREKGWYKLDNAANIYPAIVTSNWAPNFRVSVTLKEQIDPDALSKALNSCLPRFKNFSLVLRRGLFWHYLEFSDKKPSISREVRNPMRIITKHENHGYQFRVTYYNKRIALELMHVLADGSGAMMFLKAIAAEYLRIKGAAIPYDAEGLVNIKEPPKPEEMEDSFRKYAKFRTRQPRRESRAYWAKGTKLAPGNVSIVTGRVSVKEMLAKSKEYGVTITEFLASVLIWVIYQNQKSRKMRRELPVKVSVPLNLRKFYPSQSMRNFSLFINPGIEPRYGDYEFEEIVIDVHHFMRMNLKEKYLNAVMSANLSDELNPVVRILPLILKNRVLAAFYSAVGETRFSTDMSNLGAVTLPPEMEDYVEHFDFMLGRPHGIPFDVGVISYKDAMSISFSGGIEERDCEREFFRELVKRGIHVKIESNSRKK